MLRICHIIPTLDQGGAEKQLCLLAAGLDRARFETQVIALTRTGPLEASLRERGIPVHRISKRGKFDPFALRRLTLKIRELAPDVVHSWIFAANCYGRFAARRAGVPVIIAGERCVDPWKRWWHFAVDRWLLKYTRTIVTNTTAVQQFYASRGIPADRFTVIPNAIEPVQMPRMTRAEVCGALGIGACETLVLAVGRLWPQKGYKDLIWAGELLHVAHPGARLAIIGDGPQRAGLMQFRDQIEANDSVVFAGHRSNAVQLLSGADLLWNGSLYEGQSNTILEAMSLGVPVIATDIPGNRDLVIEGETGHLFKLGAIDTLVRASSQLIQNPVRREVLGRSAIARAREYFSVERMVARHAELYLRLAGSPTCND